MITNIKPKQMKVIYADPFELAGAESNWLSLMLDASEASEHSVFGDFLNGDFHNGDSSN